MRANSVDFRNSGQSSHATNGWIQVDCPFCYPNSKPGKFHLGINRQARSANCWKCGKHSIVQVLCLVLKKDRRFVWNLLGRNGAWSTCADTEKKEFKLPGTIEYNSPIVLNYLAKRWGKTRAQEIASRFGLGFLKKQWRIYIPVFEHSGNLVSWTCRAVGNLEPRFISASRESEIIPHKSTLYGEWLIGHSDTVVVCEGPTDVWNLQPLLPAVATFGIGYTQDQLQALSKYSRVVVCLDADTPGREAARRLACDLATLDSGARVFNVVLDSGDAGEMTESERERLALCFQD